MSHVDFENISWRVGDCMLLCGASLAHKTKQFSCRESEHECRLVPVLSEEEEREGLLLTARSCAI